MTAITPNFSKQKSKHDLFESFIPLKCMNTCMCLHACMYFSAQMEKWAEIVYKEGQKGNLIASRRLEWWLPQYEVDQGYLVASRRLEWLLPQYGVDQGYLVASRRLEWWLPQYEVDQGNLVASRRLEWWLPEWHALTFRNDFYDNSFLIMTPHTIKIK